MEEYFKFRMAVEIFGIAFAILVFIGYTIWVIWRLKIRRWLLIRKYRKENAEN